MNSKVKMRCEKEENEILLLGTLINKKKFALPITDLSQSLSIDMFSFYSELILCK